MGSSFSTTSSSTRCDNNDNRNTVVEAPPTMQRQLSFEEKLYAKVRKEPLVPIGCAATAYFLISGIRSFGKNRDPRRAQKMMRFRVGAQFLTFAAFVGYMGLDNVNFEVAPNYNAQKAAEEEYNKRNNGNQEEK